MEFNTVFSNFPVIQTSRLILRRISLEDVESVYHLFQQKELLEYNTWKPLANRDEAWKLLIQFDREYESQSCLRWGLMQKKSLEIIGDIALGNFNHGNKSARISYDVHPDYWQKAYASEAMKEILQFAICTLKMNRIEALVHPMNTPSVNLLEKFNFRKEGILRDYIFKNNQFHEAYIYSLLGREFDCLD